MLDQWFKRDIQNRTERHSIVVFLDEYGATEAPPLDSRFRGNDKQMCHFYFLRVHQFYSVIIFINSPAKLYPDIVSRS